MPLVADMELTRLQQIAEAYSELEKEKTYVIVYSHKHGVDAWPLIQNPDEEPPTEEAIVKTIEDWKGEDEEEYIEILGPWLRSNK